VTTKTADKNTQLHIVKRLNK